MKNVKRLDESANARVVKNRIFDSQLLTLNYFVDNNNSIF